MVCVFSLQFSQYFHCHIWWIFICNIYITISCTKAAYWYCKLPKPERRFYKSVVFVWKWENNAQKLYHCCLFFVVMRCVWLMLLVCVSQTELVSLLGLLSSWRKGSLSERPSYDCSCGGIGARPCKQGRALPLITLYCMLECGNTASPSVRKGFWFIPSFWCLRFSLIFYDMFKWYLFFI